MNTEITEQIAEQLLASRGEPVSGQQLAEQYGISRTAIWKHMKELEEQGFVMETVKKKGYVLKQAPDTLQPLCIRPFLHEGGIGGNLVYETSVASTQIVAHQLAQDGAPDGTVVLAEEQTSGRGRLSRKWQSAYGKGVWMSVILRPQIPVHLAPQFTLVAAVAAAKAIEEAIGAAPSIKWPNDILIDGKKCTGILTELQADADGVQALIIGIGLNANQLPADFPEELEGIATSLAIEKGGSINRAKLAADVLNELSSHSQLYLEEGFAPVKRIWESYSNTIGSRVRARLAKETLHGVAERITEDGVLMLRTDDGKVHPIYSADIELA